MSLGPPAGRAVDGAHTVEETYQLADAAHAGDDAKLLDELGDVPSTTSRNEIDGATPPPGVFGARKTAMEATVVVDMSAAHTLKLRPASPHQTLRQESQTPRELHLRRRAVAIAASIEIPGDCFDTACGLSTPSSRRN